MRGEKIGSRAALHVWEKLHAFMQSLVEHVSCAHAGDMYPCAPAPPMRQHAQQQQRQLKQKHTAALNSVHSMHSCHVASPPVCEGPL